MAPEPAEAAAPTVRAFETSVFANGVSYHYARDRDEIASKRVCVGYETIIPAEAATHEISGEQRLRNFMTRFHGGFRFGPKPLMLGEFQLGFMDVAAQIVASNIVGPKWNDIGPRLTLQYKWKIERAANLGLGEGPRRFGKSVSIAALVVNYCLEVPGAVVSVFTTSKRTSQLLKKKVLQMIVESGFGQYILRYGEEVVIIRHPLRPRDRPAIMSFYPSNPRIRERRVLALTIYSLFLCAQVQPASRSLRPHQVGCVVLRRAGRRSVRRAATHLHSKLKRR